MDQFLAFVTTTGTELFGAYWPVVWNLIKIVAIVLPVMGCVAYLTLWERKLIGWMHVRIGPNRVGPAGLLQPIADALKLLLKEIVVPAKASKALFVIAPVMTIMPALAAWSVVPFGPEVALANINAVVPDFWAESEFCTGTAGARALGAPMSLAPAPAPLSSQPDV